MRTIVGTLLIIALLAANAARAAEAEKAPAGPVAAGAAEAEKAPLDRPISAQFTDATLSDAVQVILESAGVDYVLPQGLSARVTASFRDTPAREALAGILKPHGYAIQVKGKRVHVVRAETKDEERATTLVSAPRTGSAAAAGGSSVQVIRLRYLDPAYLVALLQGGLLSVGGSGARQGQGSALILPANPPYDSARSYSPGSAPSGAQGNGGWVQVSPSAPTGLSWQAPAAGGSTQRQTGPATGGRVGTGGGAVR